MYLLCLMGVASFVKQAYQKMSTNHKCTNLYYRNKQRGFIVSNRTPVYNSEHDHVGIVANQEENDEWEIQLFKSLPTNKVYADYIVCYDGSKISHLKLIIFTIE